MLLQYKKNRQNEDSDPEWAKEMIECKMKKKRKKSRKWKEEEE